MPPSKPMRHRHTRRASGPLLQLESLERRLPLAGDVTAKLTGSTLLLTGDTLANDVMVASAAGGKIAVIGINTTINGSSIAFVTNKRVTSIIADLNGGNDAIGFGNSAGGYAGVRMFVDGLLHPTWTVTEADTSADTTSVSENDTTPPPPFDVAALQTAIDDVAGGVTIFSIPGSLRVTTADGDDTVSIMGNIGGSVIASLGSADVGNGLAIGLCRVGGSVTVVGGAQKEIVFMSNSTVAGRVSADLGDGTNWMLVAGEDEAPTAIAALAYTGGVDEDAVGLAGAVTVRNNVSIFTGARGEDGVDIGSVFDEDSGTVTVRGNVVVNTGTGSDDDTIGVVGNFRGNVSVTTGGGRDIVSVSSRIGWITTDGSDPVPLVEWAGSSAIGLDLNINTGAGNDLISIGTSTVGRHATIHAESGEDDVRINSMQVKRNLFIRLGTGNDSLGIVKMKAFAAFLQGGTGTNSLTTDTPTRTGNRTLRRDRFQTMTNG
jgi:hypothetical protein